MPDSLAMNCLTVGKQKRRLFNAENTEKGICRAVSRPGASCCYGHDTPNTPVIRCFS